MLLHFSAPFPPPISLPYFGSRGDFDVTKEMSEGKSPLFQILFYMSSKGTHMGQPAAIVFLPLVVGENAENSIFLTYGFKLYMKVFSNCLSQERTKESFLVFLPLMQANLFSPFITLSLAFFIYS